MPATPPTESDTEQQVLIKNSKPKPANHGKRRILLSISAPAGSEVFVAGDFNEWDHLKHRLTDKGNPGQFRRFIFVDPGRYEYKFNVDGDWQIDPNCEAWAPNQFGSLNSVISI